METVVHPYKVQRKYIYFICQSIIFLLIYTVLRFLFTTHSTNGKNCPTVFNKRIWKSSKNCTTFSFRVPFESVLFKKKKYQVFPSIKAFLQSTPNVHLYSYVLRYARRKQVACDLKLVTLVIRANHWISFCFCFRKFSVCSKHMTSRRAMGI